MLNANYFQIIDINTSSPKTFRVVHRCLYLHCKYFVESNLIRENKKVSKYQFKKSCVNNMCVPSNRKSGTLPIENDMIDVQALMCFLDSESREHRIVNDYKQKEHTKTCICDLVKVNLQPYDSTRERHKKTLLTCSIQKILN